MGWASFQVVPASVTCWLAKEASRVLKREESTHLLQWEQLAMKEPLASVPDGLKDLGPWIGSIGIDWASVDNQPPQVIVCGICQAAGLEEKEKWLRSGLSLEAVTGVLFGARIAEYYGAELRVCLPDRDCSIESGAEEDGNPKLDIEIGSKAEAFVTHRFPSARLCRSSDPEQRNCLNDVVASPEVSRLYPDGVPAAFGATGASYWRQFAFLTTVACLALPARNSRAWAVLDHDQLRSAVGAHHLLKLLGHDAGLGILLYWPAPQVTWSSSFYWDKVKSRGGPGAFLNKVHTVPRRSYRERRLEHKLHVDETDPAELRAIVERKQSGYEADFVLYLRDGGGFNLPQSSDPAEQLRQLLKRLRGY